MGDVVGCPECGQQSDVARLVAAQWTKPWHKAPGLNRVLMPVVVLVLGALTIFIVTGVSDAIYAEVPSFWTAMGMWSAVLLLWVVSLVRSALAFDRRGEAVGLSMLAHVICVMFVAAVITLIVCVILMMVQVVDGGFGVQGLINLVLSLVALLLLWLGRKGEKFIAGRCIREHLRRQARGGVPDVPPGVGMSRLARDFVSPCLPVAEKFRLLFAYATTHQHVADSTPPR